jgi:hypothetical protein
MNKSTLVILTALLLARTAVADDLTPTNARSHEPTVAITVSPLMLVVPLAEVTVEARVADKVGVAVVAGVGRFHEMDTNARVDLYEGGVSARYYVTGSFRSGIQLGGEAMYVKAATESSTVHVGAAGLGLSPFAGYKWTHRRGITFEAQAGPMFMVARAKADTGESAKRSGTIPMLNLQFGYSF